VSFSVEMEGKPCCDPKNNPVPGDASTNTIYNLLNEDNAGCGTVTGEDTGLSTLVDTDSWALFVAGNAETMTSANIGTDLFNFYGSAASTVPLNLYSRDRITVKCTAGCSTSKEFGFEVTANALFTSMASVWADLKLLCYIAGIGAGVSLLVLAYIIYLKRRAT
jgi:hypothetical protein